MASFEEDNEPVIPQKLFVLANPSAGKTGAIMSLAAAGYNVRILDMDSGWHVLRDYVKNPASPYRRANPPFWTAEQAATLHKRVHWETLTDDWRKSETGVLIPKAATAWPRALSILSKWPNDFGPISSWTANEVLVIDSLTFLSRAAFRYILSLNNRVGKKPMDSDYGAAQDQILSLIEMLYSDSIKCHVIYNCHIKQKREGFEKRDDGKETRTEILSKGFPETVGQALSYISRYVNTVLSIETTGFGRATRRQIITQPTEILNLKTIAPLRVKPSYPLETGLLQYFLDTGTAMPTTEGNTANV